MASLAGPGLRLEGPGLQDRCCLDPHPRPLVSPQTLVLSGLRLFAIRYLHEERTDDLYVTLFQILGMKMYFLLHKGAAPRPTLSGSEGPWARGGRVSSSNELRRLWGHCCVSLVRSVHSHREKHKHSGTPFQSGTQRKAAAAENF